MTQIHDNIPFIIVSAHRTGDTPEASAARHSALSDLTAGQGACIQARGVWREGDGNRSILVCSQDPDALDYVEELAFLAFDQDAVLRVDAARYATFVYAGGSTEKAGRWTEVDPVEARGQDHTLVDGRYFVAR